MARAVPVEYHARTGINSRADYETLYNRSIQDPAGFWADLARQFHWEKPVRSSPLRAKSAWPDAVPKAPEACSQQIDAMQMASNLL